MPLTKEDKRRILASNGYDPNSHYLDESTGDVYQGVDPNADIAPEPATPTFVPPATSKSTTFGAIRRGATQAAFPSLAAIGGGAVAAQSLPFAHVAPPYSEIAAGLGGALAAGFGASKLQEAIVPEAVKEAAFLRPEDIAEHPVASTIGELAPNVIAFNPITSARALARGVRGLGTIALSPRGAGALLPQEIVALKNLGINTGVNVGTQAGLNVAEQLRGDEPFSGTELAKAAALGLLFNEPTKLAQRRLGFRPSFEGVPTTAEVIARNRDILSRRPNVVGGEVIEPAYVDPAVLAAERRRQGVEALGTAKAPAKATMSNLAKIEAQQYKIPGMKLRDEPRLMQEAVERMEAEGGPAPREEELLPLEEQVGFERRDLERRVKQIEKENQKLKKGLGVKQQQESAAAKSFTALEPEIDTLLAKRGIRKGQYRVTITDAAGNVILGSKGKEIAGQAKYPTREVSFGKEAGADTAFHEAGHIYLEDMARSGNKRDRDLVSKAFREVGRPDLTAEEFVRLNDAERAGDLSARERYIDAEEALMDYIGFEGAKRKLGGAKGKQYFKDYLSRFGIGEKPSRQQLAAGLEYDAPRQLTGDEFKPEVRGTAKQQDESQMSGEEFVEFARNIPPEEKGMTGRAKSLGLNVKSLEEIESFNTNAKQAQEDFRRLISEGKLDEATGYAYKAQYFREAYEAATGTGGLGSALKKEKDYVAPITKLSQNAIKKEQIKEGVQGERSEGSSTREEPKASPSDSIQREEEGGKLSEESRAEEITTGMQRQLETAAMRKAKKAEKDVINLEKIRAKELPDEQAIRDAEESTIELEQKTEELEAFTRPDKEKNQEESRMFELATEKELRRATPFDLMLGKDKALAGNAVLERLPKFLNPSELDALKEAGIKDYLAYKRRTPAELADWIKENGPKASVVSYGMEGKISEARREMDKLSHELDTLDPNWSNISTDEFIRRHGEENLAKRDRWSDLWEQNKHDVVGPRATSAYERVSALPVNEPMPSWTKSKESKNVQRVDVVAPNKHSGKPPTMEEWLSQLPDSANPSRATYEKFLKQWNEGIVVWQPDQLHENLPNTLGWAMVQYKTGPNGERIAFITEAQSRWGQEVRKKGAKLNSIDDLPKQYKLVKEADGYAIMNGDEAIARGKTVEAAVKDYNYAAKQDHPLLKDYNRLILKAAIDQARKEGATHIVVSDAETAMISEILDSQAHYVEKRFDSEQASETELDRLFKGVKSGDYSAPSAGKDGNKWVVQIPKDGWNVFGGIDKLRSDGYKLEREGGFKFNYDDQLPKIAEELTGQKGQRVELGEHKNAFDQYNEREATQAIHQLQRQRDRGQITDEEFSERLDEIQENQQRNQGRVARKNLIFKNPDGSPKTTVSGKMFSLENVAARLEKEGPFTLHGKKFQESSKITESELRKKPLLNVFTSVTDRIGAGERSKSHIVASKALRNYFDERDFNIGRYGQAWAERYSNYTPQEANNVYRHDWEVDNGIAPSKELTANEQKLRDEIQEVLQRPKEDAARLGLKVKRGEVFTVGGLKPEGYLPNQLDPVVLAELENNPSSIDSKKYRRQWAEWLASKGAKNPEQMIKEWEAARREYGDTGGPEFAALRRPEGFGLPWELMDKNPARAAMRYGRRAASDLAWFKHIQSKDDVRAALGIKDQEGNLPKDVEGIDYIGSEKDVQSALKFVYGKTASEYPRIAAFSKFVGDMVMGPGTAIRNLASIPNNLAAYDVSFRDFAKGLSNIASARKRAIESGAVKLKPEEFERLGDIDNPDKVVALFNKLSNLFRTIQGRNLSDKLEGELYYAIGEEWAKTKIIESKAGDSRAKKLLERVGNITEGPEISSPENIQKLAKGFVNIVRGTYGPQGLPAWALHGNISPFVALSRYSIEKWNNVYKDIGIPMKEGNPLPFFKYALASLGIGAGIEELNKVISGKKGPDLELKEALAIYAKNEDPKILASKAIGLAQLASFGGIMGDLAKLGVRAAEGKSLTYSNPLSFPAYSFASETVAQNLADALGAMKEGEDPMAVMAEFIKTVSIQSVQAARYASNRLDKERTERKEEFADLRKFREATGRGTPSEEGRANEFAGLGAKKFKRTSDIREAVAELPSLIKQAFENAGKDPYRLKYELRKLKANSYQTMPSPENQPLEFYEYLQYLRDTQGNEKAAQRLSKFFRQRETNRLKSKLVP